MPFVALSIIDRREVGRADTMEGAYQAAQMNGYNRMQVVVRYEPGPGEASVF